MPDYLCAELIEYLAEPGCYGQLKQSSIRAKTDQSWVGGLTAQDLTLYFTHKKRLLLFLLRWQVKRGENGWDHSLGVWRQTQWSAALGKWTHAAEEKTVSRFSVNVSALSPFTLLYGKPRGSRQRGRNTSVSPMWTWESLSLIYMVPMLSHGHCCVNPDECTVSHRGEKALNEAFHAKICMLTAADKVQHLSKNQRAEFQFLHPRWPGEAWNLM